MSDGPKASWIARLVINLIIGGCVVGAWWFLVGRQTFAVPVPPGGSGNPPSVPGHH